MIDSNQKLVFRQTILLGDQVPSQFNRKFLEVITKREITQHLEKCMVTRGITNILKIIMFTPCPHAFLRRHSALIIACLKTGKQILELHHASIGKHERWIILWHQRAGRHDFMAMAAKILEESPANVVNAAHQ